MKIGQFPPWDISIDKNLKKILKKYKVIYKKGLECESQGYGVGAFAYYRRIVEGTIDDILVKIISLVPEENKNDYLETIKQTKKSKRADQKISMVTKYIPDTFMIKGNNPLKLLYNHLSIGIHSLSDEECMDKANQIRIILNYLISTSIIIQENQEKIKSSCDKLSI